MEISNQLKEYNVYLDANIFIYLLEGFSEYTSSLTQLFDLIDNQAVKAITSELTLAEVLVKPIMDENTTLQQIYTETIQTTKSLYVAPITRKVLITAAELRARLRSPAAPFRLPDTIHIATALTANCNVIITNDKRFKSLSGKIEIIILSEVKETALSF